MGNNLVVTSCTGQVSRTSISRERRMMMMMSARRAGIRIQERRMLPSALSNPAQFEGKLSVGWSKFRVLKLKPDETRLILQCLSEPLIATLEPVTMSSYDAQADLHLITDTQQLIQILFRNGLRLRRRKLPGGLGVRGLSEEVTRKLRRLLYDNLEPVGLQQRVLVLQSVFQQRRSYPLIRIWSQIPSGLDCCSELIYHVGRVALLGVWDPSFVLECSLQLLRRDAFETLNTILISDPMH